MPARIDIPIGTVFGRLTATGETRTGPRNLRAMACRCECGEMKVVTVGDLRAGCVTSCGCGRRMIVIPPGTVFGRLTVLEEAAEREGYRMMACRCECGQLATVSMESLRAGHTKSCGCLRRELAAERGRTDPRLLEYRKSDKLREQARQRSTTHGLSDHPHWQRWQGMMSRCTDPGHQAYPRYGGRGITVFPAWHDLAAFCAWIDSNLGSRPEGMSLDRIDNDGNYEPGNVRWATAEEQIQNSSAAKLTMAAAIDIRARQASGESRKAIAAEYGVSVHTIGKVLRGETWRQPTRQ